MAYHQCQFKNQTNPVVQNFSVHNQRCREVWNIILDVCYIARPDPRHLLQVFGERMRANGLAPKAVIGAAMRKLVHLIYGVIKSGKPFDAEIPLKGIAFQDGI
jgi:hypothetical protein